MQIRDLQAPNYHSKVGTSTTKQTQEELFAEFSETLDQIATKLSASSPAQPMSIPIVVAGDVKERATQSIQRGVENRATPAVLNPTSPAIDDTLPNKKQLSQDLVDRDYSDTEESEAVDLDDENTDKELVTTDSEQEDEFTEPTTVVGIVSSTAAPVKTLVGTKQVEAPMEAPMEDPAKAPEQASGNKGDQIAEFAPPAEKIEQAPALPVVDLKNAQPTLEAETAEIAETVKTAAPSSEQNVLEKQLVVADTIDVDAPIQTETKAQVQTEGAAPAPEALEIPAQVQEYAAMPVNNLTEAAVTQKVVDTGSATLESNSLVQMQVNSEQPSANEEDLAELAPEFLAQIVRPTAETGTSSPLIESNTARIFEKLILDRALTTASVAQNSPSVLASALTEQNLKNLVQSQLIQDVSKAQGILQTSSPAAAQGLLNSVNQHGKGAENATVRGEMKEAMKSMTRQQESRTMERVESALKEVARGKDGKTISVRLDPPDLGTVKIDVTLRDGALHARIVAETPQVQLLLKEKAQDLIQLIRKLGLNVEKVSVSVSEHSRQDSSDASLNFSEKFPNSSNDHQQGGSKNRSGGNGRGFGSLQSNVSRPTTIDDHWVA